MSNIAGAGRSGNEAGPAAPQSTRLDGDRTQTLRQTEVSLTTGNVEIYQYSSSDEDFSLCCL